MLRGIREAIEPDSDSEDRSVPRYMINNLRYARPGTKIAVFLEDFQKVSIIEFCSKTKKISYENDLEFTLYPKINHTNQKLIEEYKKLIIVYYPLLKAAFLGGLFSKIASAGQKVSNEVYAGFLTGAEIAKRVLELMKNNMDLPIENEFYIVKIGKAKVQKEIEREDLKKREQKFVLDCINKKTSHLKFYNPLFDGHLNSFFASDVIRRQLKDKGFINTNGFIMYDPKYKSIMGASPKRGKINDVDKEKKLLYAIKSINVSDDPLDKSNFDSYSKMLKSNSPTSRKLPAIHFEYTTNQKYVSMKTTTNTKKKLKPIVTEKNGKLTKINNYRFDD